VVGVETLQRPTTWGGDYARLLNKNIDVPIAAGFASDERGWKVEE